MRRITDDAARDRLPTWTPDGKSLVFYSNRGGEFEIWSIGADGGSLRKIVGRPARMCCIRSSRRQAIGWWPTG